jgi:hypothetical protein
MLLLCFSRDEAVMHYNGSWLAGGVVLHPATMAHIECRLSVD